MTEKQQYDGVAIVDDEAQLIRTYELIFQRRQIPVSFVAGDGEAALRLFKESIPRPGVVLIDYRLPSMTGMELMRAIRKMDPDVKIVIISADDSVRKDALEGGALAFLKKPVPLQVIVSTVRSLMAA
jgi:two-component system chemotaxis response regulator CheY